MAKVQIKNEKITPFGGIYFVTKQFKPIERAIDEYLGRRCVSVGYQYGEIVRAMMCNFFCCGDRTEDINNIKERVRYGPDSRLCSPDTVLRMLSQLTASDTVYKSNSGKEYRFNTADTLNALLVYVVVRCGQLVPGRVYDLDFDHEFLKAEKWDARWTYKGMLGYSPGVAVLTDVKSGELVIVGVENRDGNANVKFHQEDTLNRILYNLAQFGIRVRNARMDCGQYTCRAIVTNEKQMTEPAVIAYYNQRGAKEKILDQMDNDFGWHYLPKSEMGQNAVFMLITAIIRNFYERLLRIDTLKRFGIEARTRMKAFINRLIAVPAKWVRTGRQNVLNLYTGNAAYIDLFAEYG